MTQKICTFAGHSKIYGDDTIKEKLKTLHKLAIGLSMTLAELLDFKELNDFTFE